MDNLEYIEAYFNGELSRERKTELELRITTDPAFAEEVAFYLSSKQVAAAEIREEREKFKMVYTQYKEANTPYNQQRGLLRKLRPWAAAAAVVAGLILGGYLFFKAPSSPQQLADAYLKEHLQNLSVTMSSTEDSLQKGKRLYNEGKYTEALQQFEKIIAADTASFTAKKFAGIVCLRLQQYDNALHYFKLLENYNLFSNPALFYQSLTLLKRNLPDDEPKARQLLQQVVASDLEGKEEAELWLKKW